MDCVFEKSWYGGTPSSSWIVRGLGVAAGVGNIICVQNKVLEWRPSGSVTVATTDYYHPNHRGDTVFTTDETGIKKASIKYDAFGKTVYENNASDVKYRFSSKEWDSSAQLYYYGFRWYDPEHGIWTTKDPIGLFAGDLNVYRMVFNNPILYVDPRGLASLSSVDLQGDAARDIIKAMDATAGHGQDTSGALDDSLNETADEWNDTVEDGAETAKAMKNFPLDLAQAISKMIDGFIDWVACKMKIEKN